MGRRGREVSETEVRLWQAAMRDTKPFRGAPAPITVSAPVSPAASPSSGQTPPPPPALRRAAVPPPPLDHRSAPGLDKRKAERLRKGQLPIDGSIDLHGMTQASAHAALYRFIVASAEMGRRCLLVVTGKGDPERGGVLKNQVPRWLNEPTLRPLVLALTHAQQRHGGGGALYVLLKRQR